MNRLPDELDPGVQMIFDAYEYVLRDKDARIEVLSNAWREECLRKKTQSLWATAMFSLSVGAASALFLHWLLGW